MVEIVVKGKHSLGGRHSPSSGSEMWLLGEDWARSSVSYITRPAVVFNWCVLSVLSDLAVLISMRSRFLRVH
jgi:hypothetical protein